MPQELHKMSWIFDKYFAKKTVLIKLTNKSCYYGICKHISKAEIHRLYTTLASSE